MTPATANDRLRALAPDLFQDPKLKPKAWAGIQHITEETGYNEPSGFYSGGYYAVTSITDKALAWLLDIAEAYQAETRGNAPALSPLQLPAKEQAIGGV